MDSVCCLSLCLSSTFTLFFCSVGMVLGLLNIFSLPDGAEALSVEGARETLQNERVFTSQYYCAQAAGSCSMLHFPVSGSCSAHGFSSLRHLPFFQQQFPAVRGGQQQPVSSSFLFRGWLCSRVPYPRCLPRNSIAQHPTVRISGKFRRADPMSHVCDLSPELARVGSALFLGYSVSALE